MKYFFLSVGLILLSILIILSLPFVTSFLDKSFVVASIPENNSNIAGIEKYNLPPRSLKILVPPTSARSVLVLDLGTDTTLFEKFPNNRLPIASTTKIMTALVATEYFQQDDILTVKDGGLAIGSKVGLIRGESLSFRSLLYGLLLNSGNDAAFTIAENYPGGVTGFIAAMNKKVLDLNLKNTHFVNPAGLDDPNHYSSAFDLAQITKLAVSNPQLANIFATKETEISSVDNKYTYQLRNLNKLLSSVAGVLGVKTGYTEEAKENLVTLVSRNDHKVLFVVLGSDDRFGETTKLIDWAYTNFLW